MHTTTRKQNVYDHRLKELVRSTGKIDAAIERGVPASTARTWLTKAATEVVTLDAFDLSVADLQREVVSLRRRNARLIALLRLIVTVMKVAGFKRAQVRLPAEAQKRRVLRVIEQSREHLTLRTALRIVGLSYVRYHEWNRGQCGLEDLSSCPKSSPQQLTAREVATIHDMVTSDEYRHVPTGTLARLAERLGKVFASPSTWYRLVRLHKWRRLRQRVHSAKPKVGIRADQANEIWHVDTSLIRLINGGRAYLHAVIDNYSRRILAWRVLDHFAPGVTAQLFLGASKDMAGEKPTVLVDGGSENDNGVVVTVRRPNVVRFVVPRSAPQHTRRTREPSDSSPSSRHLTGAQAAQTVQQRIAIDSLPAA